MIKLFPSIKPYATHSLNVGSNHVLYLEECGNPRGLPVLCLQCGPGVASDEHKRRFFDPNIFRIIQFDQRGVGLSKPHLELNNNHTFALIADIESIRKHLKIDQWILMGGGWGSTLALLYAEAFPEKILYLILWGIFLGRKQDIKWFYQQSGASQIFPEAYAQFVYHLSKFEKKNVLEAFYHKLNGPDELIQMSAAKAWSAWEQACTSLEPQAQKGSNHFCLAKAKIDNYYLYNQLFLKPNQILKQSRALNDIPGIIIHGRYDVVCPMINAIALSHAWPRAELQIVRDAGHHGNEPPMLEALLKACRKVSIEFSA